MNDQNFDYQPQAQEPAAPTSPKKSGLVTGGFILGIIGICTSFIPVVNNASFVLGILALIFGGIGLAKKDPQKGRAITALVLGILAVVITLVMQASWSAAIDESLDELDYMTGEKTDEILKDHLTVTFGNFKVTTDEYGLTDTELSVTLKNKGNEKMSFDITIEAIDANGNRIATDTVYVYDLAPGQGQAVKAFEYLTSDEIAALKTATFRVSSASAY